MKYTIEEQKEHRQEWIEALRSGDYKQTTGRLRDENEYCCLGVACDISGIGRWKSYRGRIWEYTANEEYLWTETSYLPVAVQQYFGMDTAEGSYLSSDLEDGICSLMMANDKNVPFDRIADIIEDEPEHLITRGKTHV